MKKSIVNILIFFFLAGCSDNKSTSSKNELKTPLRKSSLINWRSFSTIGLQNLSFPIWFCDSVVENNKITSLVFSVQEKFPSDDQFIEDTIPDKSFEVKFKEGWVKVLIVRDYAEEVNIAEQRLNYRKKPDSLGYSEPTIINNVIYQENSILPIFTTVQNAQQYMRLEFVQDDSSIVEYKNTLDAKQQKHIFIKDSSNWNVLFIDQKFEQPKNNIYYYGFPKKHTESFKIRNLVEKTQLTTYKYFENGCIYQASNHTNGLVNRRTFSYDKSGRVIGYSDSLIAEPKDFIEKKFSEVQYEEGLPKSISTYKESDTLKEYPIRIIRFDYVFKD